jgi:hypothetical protein
MRDDKELKKREAEGELSSPALKKVKVAKGREQECITKVRRRAAFTSARRG